ncbi:hypothetical protein M6B38_205500 [Iris pallida]|uniref:Uncharacterized protein n=1 Tax=Iris pallida TaxID=29817 RepID=A0AAX6E7U1_IRIPA|nr:hypothetical protein M6B38_205500 [Iris pallida]
MEAESGEGNEGGDTLSPLLCSSREGTENGGGETGERKNGGGDFLSPSF